ncbi:MAG: C39 family peptidase [Thermodesulfobacteriota bacterium]
MHVLIAFIISASLLAGILPVREAPDNEIRFTVAPDDGIISNTDNYLPHVLQPVEMRFEMRTAKDIEYSRIVSQKYDYSCGSAALATLLKYHVAEDFEEGQIIHGLLKYGDKEKIIERRAFSLLDMKSFVNAIGYQGVGYKAEIDDLASLDMPCILPMELYGYRHFTVFKDIREGHVFLADPFQGNTSYPVEQFKKLWHQNVIFVVYPSGEEQLKLLQLKNDDLRFMDEDRTLDIMFRDRMVEMEKMPIETDPDERQYYKR